MLTCTNEVSTSHLPVIVASDRPCCSVDSSSQFILPSWLFIYYYFVSAAVAVDSSHMTASSSASWSRFSPLSNFVNGHMSVTYWHQTLEVSPGEDIRSEVEMLQLKSLYFGCANIIKLYVSSSNYEQKCASHRRSFTLITYYDISYIFRYKNTGTHFTNCTNAYTCVTPKHK